MGGHPVTGLLICVIKKKNPYYQNYLHGQIPIMTNPNTDTLIMMKMELADYSMDMEGLLCIDIQCFVHLKGISRSKKKVKKSKKKQCQSLHSVQYLHKFVYYD